MSELKYKVGDKVRIKDIGWYNENKNEDGDVELSTTVFLPEMSKYCGTIVTIKDIFYDINDIVLYQMEGGIIWGWTDEMIECLVERNGKTYPYKIGDRVVLKGNNRCATITDLKYNSWGNLSYYVKIDNDKDISIDYPTDLLLPYDNMVECKVGEEMKSEDELVAEYEELTDRAFKGGYEKCKSDIELNGFQLPEGYIFKDGNGNVINTNKIVLEKKKNDYPKTYEECSLINGCEGRISLSIIGKFTRLINARNAYWKLAGDEMGLGKPWSPDYSEESYEQGCPIKYVIYYTGTHITKERKCTPSYVLSFPTAEMRDAFYENFKKEIEECKELL